MELRKQEPGDIISTDWNSAGVTVEKIDLADWEGCDKFAFVLHNVLSEKECRALIDLSEDKGYEPALINTGLGKQIAMADMRNNDRSIVDNDLIAEKLWQRILMATATASPQSGSMSTPIELLLNAPWAHHFERKITSEYDSSNPRWRAVGLNERLRFLRYDPGTYFAPHSDGQYVRDGRDPGGPAREGERSFVTLQLYLNDGFEGGATRFSDRYGSQRGYDVIPRAGSVLLFQHNCYHEGALLEIGRKYAVRTDVMYTDKGPGWEYSVRPLA